jgi:hypothetical protein
MYPFNIFQIIIVLGYKEDFPIPFLNIAPIQVTLKLDVVNRNEHLNHESIIRISHVGQHQRN